MRRMTSSAVRLLLTGFVIAVLPASASATDIYFGMVGAIRGQTARVTIVDVAENDHTCPGRLGLYNAAGRSLASKDFTIADGEAAFLDLALEALQRGERFQIRGAVEVANCAESELIATFELYNTRTGVTTLILGHPQQFYEVRALDANTL